MKVSKDDIRDIFKNCAESAPGLSAEALAAANDAAEYRHWQRLSFKTPFRVSAFIVDLMEDIAALKQERDMWEQCWQAVKDLNDGQLGDANKPLAVAASHALLRNRVKELEGEINTPEIIDFSKAVSLEATHQRQKWGTEKDDGKEPEDWQWLLGYLSGKATRNFAMAKVLEELASAPGIVYGRDELIDKARACREKGLHHIITTAAACANWHLNSIRGDTRMRAGIEPPQEASA